MGFPGGSDGKESAWGQWQRTYLPMQETIYNDKTWVQSLGQEDPLATSPVIFLENSTGRGPWWAIVHGIAKRQTQLKPLSTHTHTPINMYIYIYIYIHTHICMHIYILFQILFPYRLLPNIG